jgi:hypothetical protein
VIQSELDAKNNEDIELVFIGNEHHLVTNEQHASGLPLVYRKENPRYVTTE